MTVLSGRSSSTGTRGRTAGARHLAAVVSVAAATLAMPAAAHASLLSAEAEDTIATVLALFVIFVVPVVIIVLFWMVHVLPEKIAHKRHHPQLEAIRTLCLLSLVFGGLLWPLAWIWAYTKPALYKLAYGTDKHPDALESVGHESDTGGAVVSLRDRVARLETQGIPTPDLKVLQADLDALEAKFVHEKAG